MLSLASKVLSKSNAFVSMTTAVKQTTRSMSHITSPRCYTSCPRTMFLQRLQRSPVVLEYYFSSVAESMKTGSVKWFDPKKGFGFIVPDDGSEDIFVHQTVIHAEGFRCLAEGEPVEYSIQTDMKGRIKADRVTGPMGSFVQGQPRRPFNDFNNNQGGGGGGGGSRFNRGGGGTGFGGGGGRSDYNDNDNFDPYGGENEKK